MAESMSDVQHRIASTKNTRQITSAMQMVQTSKLNQIQKAAVGYQDYVSKVKAVVMHLAKSHLLDDSSSDSKQSGKTAYLVITSDRGMVGSYNSNVLRETNEFIQSHSGDNDHLILAVGGTGADFYKKRGENVAYEYRGVSDVPTFNEVREIVKTVTSMYDSGVFSELYVCYNHFVNRLVARFRGEKMLPVDSETLSGDAAEDTQAETLSAAYDMEPSEKEVLKLFYHSIQRASFSEQSWMLKRLNTHQVLML
jgi:F0F1-type ATP synthase, gamma subunit